MNFINKCNGIDVGSSVTPEAKAAVKAVFDEARAEFRCFVQDNPTFDHTDGADHHRMRYLGTQCSLSGVLARLGGFDILGYHAIYGSPKAWVLDALRDCASVDYWYAFEKEW